MLKITKMAKKRRGNISWALKKSEMVNKNYFLGAKINYLAL